MPAPAPASSSPRSGRLALPAAILAALVALVTLFEGYRPVAYRDVVGILTVCYGHTGADVVAGKQYTRAECEAFLHADMAEANKHVRRCVPGAPPSAEAAFTSAAFNIGPKVVCGSTLQRRALAGDWRGACAELGRWNRAGGKVLKGLARRRAAEIQLCVSGL